MTMANLAAWSQVAASTAVLITLIYLAIELRQNTMTMRAQTRQSMVDLGQLMQDNGFGIPEDLQSRVFQPSFRAHPGHAEGTGLGLAIPQELLIARGGAIELESHETEGTTAKVRMRATDAQAVELTAGGDRPESLMNRSVRMAIEPDSRDATKDSNPRVEKDRLRLP